MMLLATALMQENPVTLFREASLSVPLWQMALYTLIISFCLLLKRHNLGLSISFVFCFYWGFIVNQAQLIGNIQSYERMSWPFFMYVGSGFIIIVLSIISFFSPN